MLQIKKILLVEDNTNDIKLVLSALKEAHLVNEVVVARDGEEAMNFLHRRGTYAGWGGGNPAVIFLDVKLPKMDGLQVLAEIRGVKEFAEIPVVMLTSSQEEKDLKGSYALGANAYVVKPLEYEDFLRAIKELGLFWAVTNSPPPGSAGQRK